MSDMEAWRTLWIFDLGIINLLRRPVLLTCRILSLKDLPWLWPHCPSLSVLHHAPHWPLSIPWISYVSQLALQARGVPSLCYAPLLVSTPLPSHPLIPRGCFLFCLLLRDAFFIRPRQRPAGPPHILQFVPLFNFSYGDPNNLPVYLIPTASLLHSTPNPDVSSMGIEVAQFQPAPGMC